MNNKDMQQEEIMPRFYNYGLAFMRFSTQRFPIIADKRIYTVTTMKCGHRHDFTQIWYCCTGQYTHQVEDRIFECEKGSVILVPPGTFHWFWIPEGGYAELVCINVIYDIFINVPATQYLNAAANLFLPPFEKELDFSFPRCVKLSRKSQIAFEKHISWLLSLGFTMLGSTWREQVYSCLDSMFSVPELALPEEYRETAIRLIQSRVKPMVQVLHYLNCNYSEKITEETLLQISAVSHTNLYRYFKRFVGDTYGEYLQHLRARHVYCYLFLTTYPMTYISDQCGFYDTQHMSQVFKKYMGQSPRQFRMIKKKWLAENPDFKSRLPKG